MRVEWDAIAGIVAALVALIMHFLHILEILDRDTIHHGQGVMLLFNPFQVLHYFVLGPRA
jgi:hypothetical protein